MVKLNEISQHGAISKSNVAHHGEIQIPVLHNATWWNNQLWWNQKAGISQLGEITKFR